MTRRDVTLRCVFRSRGAAVFQRSCECLGGPPERVTVVLGLAAVATGSGTVGLATKFAGPESVREVDSSVCRSVAVAVLAEAGGGCPGRGSSAARALAAKIAIRKRVPGAGPAAPVNSLFIFAEIGLRTVIGRLLRDCDVMRVAFTDTGCGDLNELRVRA